MDLIEESKIFEDEYGKGGERRKAEEPGAPDPPPPTAEIPKKLKNYLNVVIFWLKFSISFLFAIGRRF